MANEPCPAHNEVIKKMMDQEKLLGYQDGKIKTLCDGQETLFRKFDAADAIRIQILQAQGQVATILSQVLEKVTGLENYMDGGAAAMAGHKVSHEITSEHKQEEVPGAAGFLNKAWNEFVDKFAWMVIAIIVYIILTHITPESLKKLIGG